MDTHTEKNRGESEIDSNVTLEMLLKIQDPNTKFPNLTPLSSANSYLLELLEEKKEKTVSDKKNKSIIMSGDFIDYLNGWKKKGREI